MRRVEAEPHPSPRPRGQPVPERPQLLERAPERRARARRPLDQQADLPRDRRQALGIGAGVACEPAGPIVDVVAGVRHDPLDPERPATTSTIGPAGSQDRKSTRLNSSHTVISYAVFCLKKKKKNIKKLR